MPPPPFYGISDGVEIPAIAISGLLALAALGVCAALARRRRSMVPLYLFGAGALTVFFEPFCDVLGLGVFPEQGQVHWISALGRDLPMYVGLIYMFYWAPAWLTMAHLMQRGTTVRRYWTLCAGMVVGTCLFELLPLHFGLWRYYGTQPLRFGGFPLWWGFVNGHSLLASSVILVLLLRVLPANRRFLLVVLMPAVVLAVHTGGAMVGYLAVASTSSAPITWLGTVGAMAFCTVMCWVYSLVICRPGGIFGPEAVPSGAARGGQGSELLRAK